MKSGVQTPVVQFEPDTEENRIKTNIKIKDIDFGKQSAKLKITKSRARSGGATPNSEADDDEYYEEMQHLRRSKMKPKNRFKKPKANFNVIEDNAETQQGKSSILEKTTSSINKQMLRSNMGMTGVVSPSKIGLDDSLFHQKKTQSPKITKEQG
jgi:hypothetical protein